MKRLKQSLANTRDTTEDATSSRLQSAGGTAVRVIKSLTGLNELQSVWGSLSSADWASPVLHHDWVRICAEVFDLSGTIEIVVVGSLPSLAIAPLFRSRRGGRRLELIGVKELYEASDFLYSDGSSVDTLAAALVDSRLPVLLERILADSPIPAALRKAYRRKGFVICRPTTGYPWISLDKSWESPERHLNAGRRSDLRRARRIAEEMGPVSCEILSPDPEHLDSLLREAYEVEAGGWKAREGSALARDALRGEFYRRYAAAVCKEGALRLCFLRIGGRAAAMQLASVSGDRFWLLKIGYSDEFKRCSPGMLLMSETIRYAAQCGLRSYEFCGADEPWIRVWTGLVRPCVSLRAYPIGLHGIMVLTRDGLAVIRARAASVLRSRP